MFCAHPSFSLVSGLRYAKSSTKTFRLKLASSAPCRSGLGEHIPETAAIKSCGSSFAAVGRSDAGFKTVHFFTVIFGIFQ